jgi:hypothetical protein
MSLLGFVRGKFAAPGGWSPKLPKPEKRIGDELAVRTKPQSRRRSGR